MLNKFVAVEELIKDKIDTEYQKLKSTNYFRTKYMVKKCLKNDVSMNKFPVKFYFWNPLLWTLN